MKLIADKHIPDVQALFGKYCDIKQLPGDAITREDLAHGDILLVRSITQITADLLTNSTIQFVGNSAAGAEHIDHQFLSQHDIHLAQAAGANAQTVTDYVSACLNVLHLPIPNTIAGIIGYGHIGQRVAKLFNSLGAKVIVHDPFFAETQSLDQILYKSDIISLHVPLVTHPPHPTVHMIHENNFKYTKKDLVLINTARGSVIDQRALLCYPRTLCLDVWENEPDISLELLARVTIGTPHIAGYSAYAKRLATQMLFNAAADFFGWEKIILEKPVFQKTSYDPLQHTAAFRQAFATCKNAADIRRVFQEQRLHFGVVE